MADAIARSAYGRLCGLPSRGAAVRAAAFDFDGALASLSRYDLPAMASISIRSLGQRFTPTVMFASSKASGGFQPDQASAHASLRPSATYQPQIFIEVNARAWPLKRIQALAL